MQRREKIKSGRGTEWPSSRPSQWTPLVFICTISWLFYKTLNKIVGLARGKKYDGRKMAIISMGLSSTSKPTANIQSTYLQWVSSDSLTFCPFNWNPDSILEWWMWQKPALKNYFRFSWDLNINFYSVGCGSGLLPHLFSPIFTQVFSAVSFWWSLISVAFCSISYSYVKLDCNLLITQLALLVN